MWDFDKLIRKMDYANLDDLQQRQYRLIFIISIQLICLSSTIMAVYAFTKIWYMVALISTACFFSAMNLILLKYSKNTKLCGHIAILITLVSVSLANYIVGEIGTPYSIWFYIIPLLAVSLIGWQSLFYYSAVSLTMIVFFGVIHTHPVYQITTSTNEILEWSSHLIAYLLIVTILHSLLRENRMYEKLIGDKNYLLKAEKDKFQHLSRYDQLTNLPNRHYFLHFLDEAMDALASNYCLTVFFMDLDNLKTINDVYGHTAGDHLLRQTAKRLQTCFREDDFIARLGGDEFTAVVVHSKKGDIPSEIRKRIFNEFNKPVAFENKEYSSTISIGVATYPNDARSASELLALADSAMYATKKHCTQGDA